MGHAIHFLGRLERLSMPQADYALALYRDPKLVRYVLSHLRLPDGVDRVALALEDRPDTPHIIVSRDGGFVTCLGRDMSVGETVVVPRARIDRISAEREALRDAAEHVRATGQGSQLFRRLYRSGPGLSREDFIALRAIYPLYWPELFRCTVELADSLQRFRTRYRRGRYRRKSAAALEVLRRYWEASWAMGHMVALFGTVQREILDTLGPAKQHVGSIPFHVSWFGTRTLSMPMIVRGAWAAARAGHHLLPGYKQLFEEKGTFLTHIDSLAALTSIGLRHRRLRAEVRKVLARRRSPSLDPAMGHPDVEILRHLVSLFEKVMDREDEHRALHRLIGAAMYIDGLIDPPPDHPEHPDDVPDEIAYVLPLQVDSNVYLGAESQVLLPIMLAWVSTADIEALYLPAAVQAQVTAPWDPDFVLRQLDDYTVYTAQSLPRRRQDRPGRNQPCPCGSGKKHKRCCGAG